MIEFIDDVAGKGIGINMAMLILQLKHLKGEDKVQGTDEAIAKRIRRIIKANGYAFRRATHIGQKHKSDPTVIKGFLDRMSNSIKEGCLHPDNVVNMDKTNFYFDSPSPHTIAKKGAKTVSLKKNRTSGRCTVLLAVTLSGIKLPDFVIFKGKPGTIVEKEFEKLDCPKDTFFTVQDKAWNDSEVMLKWIEKVWKPFCAKNKEKKC